MRKLKSSTSANGRRIAQAAASGFKRAIVTFKIGFKVYLMTDEQGVTVRYPTPAHALRHIGKVRANAIASGFMAALISDVLVDFRIHPASVIGDEEMGSIMERFGQVCGVALGDSQYIIKMHYGGLEPKAPLKAWPKGPTRGIGGKRKQLV
jgi:hypothetical protein